jgi:hypothetical protein
LPEKLTKMGQDERVEFVARKVWSERTDDGRTPLEFLHDFLYGGPRDRIPERLFDACWRGGHMPHMNVSTLGEIVGWALPESYPPRNGRTSKALFAFGYDVTIHTEA